MFHFYDWSIAFAALILRDSSVLLQPYFFWPSHILLIYRIIARSLSFSLVSFSRDATSVCGRGIGAKSIICDPDGPNFSFHLSRVIADHHRNLGCVRKIETLSILWNCSRPSQAIGDIYDFEFSFVNKICESRETIKSQIVWDFPNIWKPGLNLPLAVGKLQIFLTDMTPRLYSFLRWNFKCSSFTPEKNLDKIYTAQRVKWIIQHLTSHNVVYSVQ